MKTSFRSKVDWWIIAILAVCVLPPIYFNITDFDLTGCIISCLCIVFLLMFIVPCRYKIVGEVLDIRCGVMHFRIKIDQIRTIRPTHNSLSSPAMSIDRLELKMKNGDVTMLSPKDKKGFIDSLKSINPEIECTK